MSPDEYTASLVPLDSEPDDHLTCAIIRNRHTMKQPTGRDEQRLIVQNYRIETSNINMHLIPRQRSS